MRKGRRSWSGHQNAGSARGLALRTTAAQPGRTHSCLSGRAQRAACRGAALQRVGFAFCRNEAALDFGTRCVSSRRDLCENSGEPTLQKNAKHSIDRMRFSLPGMVGQRHFRGFSWVWSFHTISGAWHEGPHADMSPPANFFRHKQFSKSAKAAAAAPNTSVSACART